MSFSNTGLSVSDVVNVSVNLGPKAVPVRNFGAAMFAGPSDVIDVNERIRVYSTLNEVGADFSTTSPEWLAADLFFSQSPQPSILYIGRWAQGATKGLANGGILSSSQQALSNFTGITNGGFHLTLDGGSSTNYTAINLSGAANLNAVAALIDAALPVGTNFVWDSVRSRFTLESATTGAASAVSFMTAPTSGTDLSAVLRMTAATGASQVGGIVAETPLACAQILARSGVWYGLEFAPVAASDINDAAHIAVAGFIEGASPNRIYGITSNETNILDGTVSNDLASTLKSLGYSRTFIQYSSNSAYAAASMIARAFTVDFNGNNTTITLMFKQEPGVIAETLTETQAAVLALKNCNVFVNYQNNTAIIQNGVMCDGTWFDLRHGADWQANRVQTDLFNVLYTSPTKVPQTDAGMNILLTTAEASMAAGVNNGLWGPGVWNAPGFGSLKQGDTVTKGYYCYMTPLALQSEGDRQQRIAPPMQIAAKSQGAVHKVNVTINVNQ
jgi:hypothetical protein